MTEKEEKFMLSVSFIMLIAAGVTVAVGLYLIKPVSGEASEQVSANDGEEAVLQQGETEEPEEPYQELYYLAGQGFFAGSVAEANEKHAECFVILECGDENTPAGEIVLFYNDDFIIPEFDSRALVLEMREYLIGESDGINVAVVFSEDTDLKEAMLPAVRIHTGKAVSDIKPMIGDCMKTIFTETEEKP